MASPLLPWLVLVLGSSCYSIVHGIDAQRYMVVSPSSLKPSEICSGHKVIPSKNGTTLQVTHRHGPCSPVISKEKPSVQETLRRDQHRAAYIHRKVSGNASKELQQSAVTIPTNFGYSLSLGTPEYMVTVSLGTPAVSQTMNMDTGSDISWVQCAPCAAGSCYSQKDKLFDPAKSSTYAAFSCASAQCAQLGGEANGCLSSQCQYVVPYGDGSNTTGTYGSDTLRLSPSAAPVKNFQFGCSHRAAGFVGQMDGLMGLGGDTESLVSQTAATYGRAFSYCLPRPSSSAGFLTLGAAGGAAGYARTPMARFRNVPTFYGVLLQAITVGGTRLKVPASVFSGASIVDSGTVITELPPTAYQALRTAFRKEMKAYPAAPPVGNLDTCFNFDGFDTIAVPKVTLTFARGAVMDLDVTGILYGGCLAFTSTGQDGATGILGNVQQRTFEVLFDVGGGTVGFKPAAC